MDQRRGSTDIEGATWTGDEGLPTSKEQHGPAMRVCRHRRSSMDRRRGSAYIEGAAWTSDEDLPISKEQLGSPLTRSADIEGAA